MKKINNFAHIFRPSSIIEAIRLPTEKLSTKLEQQQAAKPLVATDAGADFSGVRTYIQGLTNLQKILA